MNGRSSNFHENSTGRAPLKSCTTVINGPAGYYFSFEVVTGSTDEGKVPIIFCAASRYATAALSRCHSPRARNGRSLLITRPSMRDQWKSIDHDLSASSAPFRGKSGVTRAACKRSGTRESWWIFVLHTRRGYREIYRRWELTPAAAPNDFISFRR